MRRIMRRLRRSKKNPRKKKTTEAESHFQAQTVAQRPDKGDVIRTVAKRSAVQQRAGRMAIRQERYAREELEPERAPRYDKVCVRDLILPARIGIWSEEQGITQRVRFSVELSVLPGGHRPGDLSSVVSYDYIIDGIKESIAVGHVLLTETIAERIAEHCLSHRRAVEVRVVVEKLDRIPGAALGCEIVRSRSLGQP
jgi:7,8-dihydroneopterin aldolase/epimerase/oxygenase